MNKQELALKYGVDQSRIVVIEQKTSSSTTLLVAIVLVILCVSFPFIGIPMVCLFVAGKIAIELVQMVFTKMFWIILTFVVAMVAVLVMLEEYSMIDGLF